MVGATQVGQCTHTGGTTLSCGIYNGDTVAASKTVAITLEGVTNPAPGSYTLTVATTSDTSPVTSPSYTIVAAQTVTNVTITVSSPSAAAGALINYQVGFKTS